MTLGRNMKNKCVIIGAGGHAKVVIDIVRRSGKDIIGLTDVTIKEGNKFMGYPVLGNDDRLSDIYESGVHEAVMGIGHVGEPWIRNQIFQKAVEMGFTFPNLMHPAAVLSENIHYGEGNLFGAHCTVNADAVIGSLCIINTAAIIEHESVIGDGVHIAPHATVLGGGVIGKNTFVGAGSVILQGAHIGDNCIVGAGSIVLHDVEDSCIVVGNPGRVLRRRI